ncbi:MAG: transposase [Janthinobacterium lividum]
MPRERPKKTQPSCVIIDTQSVKNAATATGSTVGFDGGKLVKGRKHLVLIDTLGNLLASWVVPAGESGAATAIAFWDAVAAQLPLLGQVEVVMGDSSFTGLFADHLRQGYDLRFEKPTHILLKKKNFCIHKKRWLVERTLAWLSANRRLSKEYDRLLTRANAWLIWANIRRILKFC